MARKAKRLAAVFESEQLQGEDLLVDWDLNFNVKNRYAFTENQKKFVTSLLKEDTKIVFADGRAGTAKTYLSVFGALTLLAAGKLDQIIYIRSVRIGSFPNNCSNNRDVKIYLTVIYLANSSNNCMCPICCSCI